MDGWGAGGVVGALVGHGAREGCGGSLRDVIEGLAVLAVEGDVGPHECGAIGP